MTFADYFWNLATRAFKRLLKKEDSDAWVWFQGIGPAYDDAKGVIFSIREQALVATATGDGLDKLGKDRKMPRLAGETDDDYRKRLLAAYDIYREGGTEPGLLRVLSILGYPVAEVYPLYKEKYKWRFIDGSRTLDGLTPLASLQTDANSNYLGRWAEFLVKLNIGDQPYLPIHHAAVKFAVNKSKPGESKLYALLFNIRVLTSFNHVLKPRLAITVSPVTGQAQVKYLNQRNNLDGAWSLQDERNKIRLSVNIKTGVKPLEQKAAPQLLNSGYWLLDGGGSRYQLDGRWQLDAWTHLDGSRLLDGSFKLAHKHYLGEVMSLLDGRRTLGNDGDKLDGSRTLGALPTDRHRLSFTTWKNGVLLERRCVN